MYMLTDEQIIVRTKLKEAAHTLTVKQIIEGRKVLSKYPKEQREFELEPFMMQVETDYNEFREMAYNLIIKLYGNFVEGREVWNILQDYRGEYVIMIRLALLRFCGM